MVAKFLDLNNLPWQRRPEETYGVLFCSWVQSCTGKSYMSSIFVFFFCHTCRATFAVEIHKFCYPQPPHHPTTTKHTLHAAVCIPRSRKIWYPSAYSPKCPLCICCCTKDKRSAYSNDILHIANVFFRLQWYFCLFLRSFWESSSTVLSSYNV